jgi:hypothetical protein
MLRPQQRRQASLHDSNQVIGEAVEVAEAAATTTANDNNRQQQQQQLQKRTSSRPVIVDALIVRASDLREHEAP